MKRGEGEAGEGKGRGGKGSPGLSRDRVGNPTLNTPLPTMTYLYLYPTLCEADTNMTESDVTLGVHDVCWTYAKETIRQSILKFSRSTPTCKC